MKKERTDGYFQKGQPPGPGAHRPKGSKNKILGKTAAEIIAGGESPIDFLVRTYQDEEKEYPVRLDAAKAAAPYLHPRLSSVDVTGDLNATVVIRHDWKGKQPSEG